MHPRPIPGSLRAVVPELRRRVSAIEGDPAQPETQSRLTAALGEVPEWRRFTAGLRPLGLRPLWLGAGLDVARDDAAARRLLAGLAISVFPGGIVPPYEVGGAAVTEVTPRGGSVASHSQNDLPAPPHTAGFFEPVPPMAVLFACVRPHPGGGAETTVVDVEQLLGAAQPERVRAWEERRHWYRTPVRLGASLRPLRLLRHVRGLPFLRYRRDYTLAEADGAGSLGEIDRLVADPSITLVFPLARDEILVHWNGAPHGRRRQLGPTPTAPGHRRLLLRCRVQPAAGWAESFLDG
jgi:hypothetical protein